MTYLSCIMEFRDNIFIIREARTGRYLLRGFSNGEMAGGLDKKLLDVHVIHLQDRIKAADISMLIQVLKKQAIEGNNTATYPPVEGLCTEPPFYYYMPCLWIGYIN